MNWARLTFFSAWLCLLGCSAEDDNPTSFTNGPPLWVEEPSFAVGAVTFDMSVNTDRVCKVHYVIATEDLGLSAQQVVEKSQLTETGPIYSAGVIEINGLDPVVETIDAFEDTEYFAYLVAQNIGDTLYLDEPQVATFNTVSRQDTIAYFSTAENRNVKYLIYRPDEVIKYPDISYPACFFLGGETEISSTGEIKLIKNGTLPEVIHLGHDVPCLVISPQHVAEDWNGDFVTEFVNYAKANYAIQSDMVYMTGIGSGAYATWEYVKQHPEAVAAIAPISGDVSTTSICNLTDVAVWAFHNDNDLTVSADNMISAIQALDACVPTREVKSLIFPDPGHDCWKRVYNYDHPDWSKSPGVEKFDLFEWFLSISK